MRNSLLLISFITTLFDPFIKANEQEVFTTKSSSAQQSEVLSPTIDTFIEGTLKGWNSSAGVSVTVVRKGHDGHWKAETKGYGIAKADGTKVDADTLFSIGSHSKTFDIIATGLLISNESLSPRISWDTKLSSIVPQWRLMDPIASGESTIVDLMSHRTGMPRHDRVFEPTMNVTSLIFRLRYLQPFASFRYKFQYTNIMYTVLSYLPEVLIPSHPKYARYLKEHILDALNLTSTTLSYEVARKSGSLADGFAREGVKESEGVFGKGTTRPMPYWVQDAGAEDGNVMSGPGGIISSARDMSTWLQTLLLQGKNPFNSVSVIPPEVIEKMSYGVSVMLDKAPFPEMSPWVYGGAQIMYTYRGHTLIEHGGDAIGFHAQISRFPFDDLGIAVLSNDDKFGAEMVEIIKCRIVDEALGLKPLDWNGRYKNLTISNLESQRKARLPRPAHPSSPSAPLQDFQGIYRNLGYGGVEVCYVPPGAPGPRQNRHALGLLPALEIKLFPRPNSEASALAPRCHEVVGELSERLPGVFCSNCTAPTPMLVIKWPKMWSTHVKLEHFDGDLWNVTEYASMPTRIVIDGADQSYWAKPRHEDDISTAEFWVENGEVKGFGIGGDFWGHGIHPPESGSGAQRAEVWFERIG